ncbi:MAG: DUF2806 domain-containing protein [Betaproteobacteria bacterium]|nr:DUF2806 domain-containing protein [Betaproteobacteria bacterium]
MLENLPEIIKTTKGAFSLAKLCAKFLGLNKPEQIREEAQAQADAKIIDAKADAEARKIRALSDLEVLGLGGLAEREKERQENRQKVFVAAVKALSPDADPEIIEKADKDKVARIFRESEITSDEELLLLWGKILAGEAEKSGSFSKRTISIVGNMEKKDAQIFTDLCQFVWHEMSNVSSPILAVYDSTHTVYNKQGIIFSALKYLEEMGLISYSSASGYARWYSVGNGIVWRYHDKVVFINNAPKDAGRKSHFVSYGAASLTNAGEELYPICGAQPNEEFFQFIIEKWKKDGLNPTILPLSEK